MLDFEAVRAKRMTLQELAEPLTLDDLRTLTNEMVDQMLELIDNCEDEDVVMPPIDPAANDPHAATPEEVHMPWTLGHVIVHATASTEEAAFLAAELARGVVFHGRSRYETPWQEMTTIAGCRGRLEENRRMRLASLDLWPRWPHLDNTCEIIPTWPPFNPVDRFIFGLMHDDSHLGQIAEIARQGRAARHSL